MKHDLEQFKTLLRALVVLILVMCQSLIFAYAWLRFYNQLILVTFAGKGNVMMLFFYAAFLILFLHVFEGLKFGIHKTISMVISQVLAVITTNFTIYLQIVLMAKRFVTFIPMFYATIVSLISAVFLTVGSDFVFRKCFPPRRILLIYDAYEPSIFIKKLASRKDKYFVERVVNISVGIPTLEKLIRSAQGVIIYDVHSSTRNKLLKLCFKHDVRAYTTTKVSDVLIRSAERLHVFDTPLLVYSNNNLSFRQRFVKRSMDIIISLLLLSVLSPLFFVCALAIKLYDGGPVFFRQKRTTINGKIFNIHKFRSMVVDAEKDKKPCPATDNDPRITPIGRIIRFCRMDELPQLIDVLVGNMSLVGPRPERDEYTEKYTKAVPEFEYRLKVRAGLTGYAQLYGKYNTSPYDKLQLDLIYIQNYSFLLDIQIMLMTLKVIFLPESTEGFSIKEQK